MRRNPNATPLTDSAQLRAMCNTIAAWLNKPAPQIPAWTGPEQALFRHVARVHGVAPLLYQKLGRTNRPDGPAGQWLKSQYQLNARRISRMHHELGQILALFYQHNIPLMPLKGSILSARFYPRPACRPMADLDLLVLPGDFSRGRDLLGRLGYRPNVAHWKHTDFIKPGNRRVVFAGGEHPDNPRPVELHRYCRESFGGAVVDITQQVWVGAATETLLGQPARLPPAQALWLHLLVHTSYHLWQGRARLIHLVDLTRLLPHLDTPAAGLSSVDARFTLPALAMLRQYFPACLDAALLEAQQKRVAPGFWRWVGSLDLVNSSCLNPKPAGPYLFRALKFSRGHPREMGRALRQAFLPGRAEMALDHPRLARSRVWWLAYLLLPLDWAGRFSNPSFRGRLLSAAELNWGTRSDDQGA